MRLTICTESLVCHLVSIYKKSYWIWPFLGPVVRITPDEVHIQEPFRTSSYSDDWIKGTGELESGHYQGGSVHNFQYKRPSISRARSLLRVEVNHIINTLIEKHQAHRMFSSRLGLFLVSPWSEKKVQPVGDTSQSKFTPTLWYLRHHPVFWTSNLQGAKVESTKALEWMGFNVDKDPMRVELAPTIID